MIKLFYLFFETGDVDEVDQCAHQWRNLIEQPGAVVVLMPNGNITDDGWLYMQEEKHGWVIPQSSLPTDHAIPLQKRNDNGEATPVNVIVAEGTAKPVRKR